MEKRSRAAASTSERASMADEMNGTHWWGHISFGCSLLHNDQLLCPSGCPLSVQPSCPHRYISFLSPESRSPLCSTGVPWCFSSLVIVSLVPNCPHLLITCALPLYLSHVCPFSRRRFFSDCLWSSVFLPPRVILHVPVCTLEFF